MRGTRIAAGLCAALWATGALAQAVDPAVDAPVMAARGVAAKASARGRLQPARVLQRPAGDAVAHLYPDTAQRLGIGGEARVKCDIGLSTSLQNCRVLSETPPGYGFGAAALQLAAQFRVAPPTLGGVALRGASIIVPVTFKIDRRPRAATPIRPRRPAIRAPAALWIPMGFVGVVLAGLALALMAPPQRRDQFP